MTESDARSLARTGEFHIQEAIMGLLDDAADGLMFGQLVRILALPDNGYDATVTGQLRSLQAQGKVHQPRGERTEWALTDAEKERRQGGLNTE